VGREKDTKSGDHREEIYPRLVVLETLKVVFKFEHAIRTAARIFEIGVHQI
jgi:hypothetical protein